MLSLADSIPQIEVCHPLNCIFVVLAMFFLKSFGYFFFPKPRLLEETAYERRNTSKIKNNDSAFYVGSSLTVHNPLFLITNCDGIYN